MLRIKTLLLTALVLLCLQVSGQGRLVSVQREQILSLKQQIDSVVQEFGLDVQKKDLAFAFRLLKVIKRDVHCVALTYRTVDPKGREITASGLISYPERGVWRGTVEMSPYNREKPLCGSSRLYTTEVLASVLGYVTLIPDNIGYGATDSLAIAYQMSGNSALVSAHLREAATEYFREYLGRQLPRNTYLFGYSLGAPNALALAYHYANNPQSDVRMKAVCLGSGAYDPALAFELILARGEVTYLFYPGLVRSLNTWMDTRLDPSKLFCGRVLEDYEIISEGMTSPLDLSREYGTNIHSYLNPDFFNGHENPDILRLKEALKSLSIPPESIHPLPASVQVVLRHSAEDGIVPVACTDVLYQHMKAPWHSVTYYRNKKGTHYETAVRSFIDLALLLL